LKTKNKPSYWGMVFRALIEARKTYREKVFEANEKEKLLSSKSNWSMLEKFIQECNKNPDLKITVRFNDGTTAILSAYKPERPSINQMLNDITVEAD